MHRSRANQHQQQVCAYVIKFVIHILCQGTTFYRTTSADHIVTLADAIRVMAKSVLENATVVLEIRRTFVVKDALKEARKAKFKLAKVI